MVKLKRFFTIGFRKDAERIPVPRDTEIIIGQVYRYGGKLYVAQGGRTIPEERVDISYLNTVENYIETTLGLSVKRVEIIDL